MSSLSAQAFINKLASDSNFRSEIGIDQNMEVGEFRNKALAAGYNYTTEELLTAALNQQSGVLSDDDLDNVSGGAASYSYINLKLSSGLRR